MQVDDRQVRDQRAHAAAEPFALPGAERLGAEHGHRLGDPQLVGAGEQSEQILRMVARRRLLALERIASGDDGGERVLREIGHGGSVAVPGAARRESGEMREALGVDPSLLVHEGGDRQLVEHHHDDRVAGLDTGDHTARRRPRQEQLADWRAGQEDQGEHQQHRRQKGQVAPHSRQARDEHRPRCPQSDGAEQGRAIAEPVHLLEGRQQDRAQQQGDESAVEQLARPSPQWHCRQLEQHQRQRHQHDQHEDQRQQIHALGAPGDEELGIARQQAEQRLRHREAGQGDEVQQVRQQLAASSAHPGSVSWWPVSAVIR